MDIHFDKARGFVILDPLHQHSWAIKAIDADLKNNGTYLYLKMHAKSASEIEIIKAFEDNLDNPAYRYGAYKYMLPMHGYKSEVFTEWNGNDVEKEPAPANQNFFETFVYHTASHSTNYDSNTSIAPFSIILRGTHSREVPLIWMEVGKSQIELAETFYTCYIATLVYMYFLL